jgi:hypothetical protein
MSNISLTKVYSSGKNGHMGRGSRPVLVKITNGNVTTTKDLHDVEGTGFTWGFNGRRDINLAHSIMVDYFEDPDVPRGLWITFYDEVMSAYTPEDEWDITGQEISEWIYRRFHFEEDTEPIPEPVVDRRKPDETTSVNAGGVSMNAVASVEERKVRPIDEFEEDKFEKEDKDFDDADDIEEFEDEEDEE